MAALTMITLLQDLQGAADAYTAVLALSDAANADKLAAASNRAACSLAQHSYTNAVNDCSLALGLLIGRHVPDVHAWLGPSHQGGLSSGHRSCTLYVLYMNVCQTACVKKVL